MEGIEQGPQNRVSCAHTGKEQGKGEQVQPAVMAMFRIILHDPRDPSLRKAAPSLAPLLARVAHSSVLGLFHHQSLRGLELQVCDCLASAL